MAFRSNDPVTVTFPPFRGVVRQLVLASAASFVVIAILRQVAPHLAGDLTGHLALHPAYVFPFVWQIVTYPFISVGLLNTLFALYSVWIFGSMLEDRQGPRWLAEYFFVSMAGGGILACIAASFTGYSHSWMGQYQSAWGMWPAVMAFLLAFARFFPDQPIRLMGLIALKARHLAAAYLLLYLVLALLDNDRFGATVVLAVTLVGFLYIRFAPRRGLRFLASETMFSWRNAWYRYKRRNAARKFKVYMRDQGRDVNIDSSGRYVGLDDEKRDPNDKRWMN